MKPVAVGRELEAMALEGLARRSGSGWIRIEGAAEADAPLSLGVSAKGH